MKGHNNESEINNCGKTSQNHEIISKTNRQKLEKNAT